MHPDDIKFAVQVTRLLAMRSRATRARVGCVIWDQKKRTICAVGYNGTPAGDDNTMERDNVTLPHVIHAEVNALSKMSRWNRWWNPSRYTLFVTHAPCIHCATQIHQAHIRDVRYLMPYGGFAGVEYLQRHGVRVQRIVE